MAVKLGGNRHWRSLEHRRAVEWLVETYGQRTYDMLYAPLLRQKFRERASEISAAWIWARFHRVGNSRTLTQKERLGYLEGGTETYVRALRDALRSAGATLLTSTPAERIVVENGRVAGVQVNGDLLRCDALLATLPVPSLLALLDGAQGAYFDNLRRLEYIDVLVITLRLRRSFSPYFWMNISDPEIDLAGIIEYTNLNRYTPLDGDALLYLPQYLPASHRFNGMSDAELLHLHCEYLAKINPSFDSSWVVGHWVHRSRFAQPICDVGFAKKMPALQTPIENLYLTDSCQLHPNDRMVCGSTSLGKQAARLILARRET